MRRALGLIEVEGVAGIVVAADAACKAAAVELLGWESIGGFTTVFFQGSVSDVAAALKSGEAAARQVARHVVAAPLNQPEAACLGFVSFPVDAGLEVAEGALGLIETRGYGAHVPANDRMLKTAGVELFNVLTVHNRVVCSLILGEIGAVEESLATGRALVSKSEHFLASALLSQPLPEVLRAFAPRPVSQGV